MPPVGGHRWHMIDEIDLVGLVADHADLARLCDDLEGFADRLPAWPSPEEIGRLREELDNRLPTHEARETALIGALFDATPLSPAGRILLAHVHARRAACVVQGQDLAGALGGDGQAPAPETLGYMLRCFFQACRQAMAFEELAILHLAARRLTPAGAAMLCGSLETRCAS